MNVNRVATQDRETVEMIRDIVKEYVQEKKLFFALEVSNEVKLRGAEARPAKAIGQRHRDISPAVEELLTMGNISGYSFSFVPVNSGQETAILYHPAEATSADIALHENRTVETVPPVDILLNLGDAGVKEWRDKLTPYIPQTRLGKVAKAMAGSSSEPAHVLIAHLLSE